MRWGRLSKIFSWTVFSILILGPTSCSANKDQPVNEATKSTDRPGSVLDPGPFELRSSSRGPEWTSCPQPETPSLSWQSTLKSSCGWVELAVNDEVYRLRVAIIGRAIDDELEPDQAVVFHPGGPGLSPVHELVTNPPYLDYDSHYLIAWDGATSSEHSRACGQEDLRYGLARGEESFISASEGVARECDTIELPLPWVGVESAANELRAVLDALGINKVDLWTLSYGTAIAEEFIKTYSDRVDRAVLDGWFGVAVGWEVRLRHVAEALDSATNGLLDSCGDECSSLLAEVLLGDGGYASVRDAVSGVDPSAGTGSTALDLVKLDQATLLTLRGEQYFPQYLEAVGDALAGDGSTISRLASNSYSALDRVVFLRTVCHDLDLPEGVEDLAQVPDGVREVQLLSAYLAEFAPCYFSTVPSPSLEAVYSEGGMPLDPSNVLVVAGERDPLTPAGLIESGSWAAQNGQICQRSAVGHTSTRSDPAVVPDVVSFLDSGQVAENLCR